MRAIGQITITNICDVVASDTPPENPYVGQLWVDTSVSPPETKSKKRIPMVYDGHSENSPVRIWRRRPKYIEDCS